MMIPFILPDFPGVTRIGREDAPVPQDIIVQGSGIEAEHCLIINEGWSHVTYYNPLNNTIIFKELPTLATVQSPMLINLINNLFYCIMSNVYFNYEYSVVETTLPVKKNSYI